MATEPRVENSGSSGRNSGTTRLGTNGVGSSAADVVAGNSATTAVTKNSFESVAGSMVNQSAPVPQLRERRSAQAPMGKNIIIFSDGTGQEGGIGNNTNVYALFNMILDRSKEQISFYGKGLGTGDNKVQGAMVGAGIGENVADAYQFLSDNYEAGDRIYLFGFSRGATTVRSLSAFIHLFGILPKSRPELFDRAWKIYRIEKKDKRAERAREFVERNHTMWTKIRFLGVWDTVAALALPFKTLDVVRSWFPQFRHAFHDLKMAKSVEYGRHALAIDDLRRIFLPVLFEERGSGCGNLFCSADISNLYLAAATLLDKGNPVSRRLFNRLESNTQLLLAEFRELEGRLASGDEEERLRNAIVSNFNTIIQSNQAICDLSDAAGKADFTDLNLSAATRECLDNISSSSSNEDINRLNRLLIEDVYSLKPRIKQVWFTGMHSDVGGGYAESGLAHIPLLWMVSEAMDLGLKIYPKHEVNLRPEVTAEMHDSRTGLGRMYRSKERSWNPQRHQGRPPLVHKSVKEREATAGLEYKPWVTKAGCEIEPWPDRLRRSIQYNEHRIWRCPLWGWGSDFDEKWSDIERISLNPSGTGITLHMKRTGLIHVRGSLPRNLPPLVNKLERIREHHRLRTVDALFEGVQDKLAEKVDELERTARKLSNYIEKDEGRAKKTDKELKKMQSVLADIKNKPPERPDL